MERIPRLNSDARLPQQRRIPEYQRLRNGEQDWSEPNPYAPSAFTKEAPGLRDGKHDGPEPRVRNRAAALEKALEMHASPLPRQQGGMPPSLPQAYNVGPGIAIPGSLSRNRLENPAPRNLSEQLRAAAPHMEALQHETKWAGRQFKIRDNEGLPAPARARLPEPAPADYDILEQHRFNSLNSLTANKILNPQTDFKKRTDE